MARTNPYARAAITGAVGGGIYGAFSDNTSILGGMAKGAALGTGLRGGFAAGKVGAAMYRMGRYGGRGVAGAATAAVLGLGKGSASLIGNTAKRAYNPIASTLKTVL